MAVFSLRKSVAALSVAFTISFSPSAWADTLTDVLIQAYKHSGLLEQNRALLRAADEDAAQAVAALRPVISYVVNAGYRDGPFFQGTEASAGLSFDWLLYDFGRSQLNVEVAQEAVLATREALVQVEQSVLFDASSAYFRVLRDIAFVKAERTGANLIAEELQASRDRFEVGEVTLTDVSIAEARLAAARSGIAAAEGALAISREAFRNAVGHYPGDLSPVANLPQVVKSLEEARRFALQRHPLMRQAQREVTIAELRIGIADAARLPTIVVGGQATRDDNGVTNSSVGLTLRGPIYQGGAIASGQRQAIALRDAARGNLHVVRQRVAEGVGNAWATLLVSQASLKSSEEQIRASRKAFEGTREEAKLGARTTLEVLDSQQDLLLAEASRIGAVSDRYTAVVGLLASMGMLTVETLNLGVPSYDPEAYYNSVKNAPAGLSKQGRALDRVLRGVGKN